MKVLLVEDEPSVSLAGAVVLKHLGHSVELALDGAEALEWLQAEGNAPDALIVDLALPEVPGQTVLRRARELHPAAVLIATSGSPLTQELVCDERLPKPFGPSSLKACLARAVASARRRAG
jgi:DNA-binding response OmpR family regulator